MRPALCLTFALSTLTPLALTGCNGSAGSTATETGSTGGTSESASTGGSGTASTSDASSTDTSSTAAETESSTAGESSTGALGCPQEPIACTREALLIAPETLSSQLDEPALVLLDLRSASAYGDGHIPGAVAFDANQIRAEVDGIGGQVADRAAVEAALGEAGVGDGVDVVAYDDGSTQAAARLSWTLHYYGAGDRVRVLDGGWTAWGAGEHPTSTDPESPSPAALALADGDPGFRVDAAWVSDHLNDPAVALVDARSLGEYEGGRIPGAVHLPWETTKTEDGRFLADTPLRALYEIGATLEADTLVTYCQTGSRASVTWLAAMLLGHPDVRIYDGSWAEWGNDPELPKEP